MRRLVLVLIACLLAAALACAPGAGAAKVVRGSAHKAGAVVKGSLVVEGTGAKRGRASGHVSVTDGRLHRPLGNWAAASLRPGERRRVRFSFRVPAKLHLGRWSIDGCTKGACLRLGQFWIVAASGESGHSGSGTGTGTGTKSGSTSPSYDPAGPISTVPTDPLSHPVEEPFAVNSGGVHYFGFVPGSYDPNNQTATPLLIWLHGCYGEAEGDAWVVDPGEEQGWLTLSLAGREGGGEGVCWIPSVDEAKLMAALADFETHFNVNRRRVILAGYSSGGDLAYRTGFRHSSTFAGLLIANSTPFRDTESSAAESLAAATTRFHIVALAHEQDETYPVATVVKETNEVKAAGFPLTLIERRGEHWNEPGEKVEGVTVPGTDADIRAYLLPHIDDGWLAPAP
jgi:pimeloyl-ACP methyl ester carboxylesterase